MERKPVTSSNITSVGYDESKQELQVEFANGSVWAYSGVQPGEHRALITAPSLGSYFHQHIRQVHQGRKVEG